MAGSVRAAKAREHALRQQGVSKAAAAAGAVSGARKQAKAKKKRSRDAPTCVGPRFCGAPPSAKQPFIQGE